MALVRYGSWHDNTNIFLFFFSYSSFCFPFFLAFALYFCHPVFISGDEDEDEGGEERLPSCFDYVMHFLTVFWKVLFACVPPTEYWNGWACFIVSIVIIGLLTAVIGDLASHFGCTIGLKDSVTAVVFVALGTSIPGEFAYAFICLHFYKYVFNGVTSYTQLFKSLGSVRSTSIQQLH